MNLDRIEPNTCPDGIVVQIRRASDLQLLRESRIRDLDQADAAAADDFDASAQEGAVVITYYDGDTGEKMWVPPAIVIMKP